MQVTAEINDYSDPRQPQIRVHSHWCYGDMIELEVEGKRYTVKGSELISAIKRCMLDCCQE